MTVCSRASISAMETSRHRWAIWRGSDWRRKSRLPYFCVFSSLGKKPSWSSRPSPRWSATSFCCRIVSTSAGCVQRWAHLFQCHAVLDQQGYSRVEIAHILFQDEVLLGLRRDLGLEFAEYLLGCEWLVCCSALQGNGGVPRARSSSISSSLSLADMDRYRAVTE